MIRPTSSLVVVVVVTIIIVVIVIIIIVGRVVYDVINVVAVVFVDNQGFDGEA